MGRKRKRKNLYRDGGNNNFDITAFFKNIENFINNFSRKNYFKRSEYFTPIKCVIYLGVLATLMFSGVGILGVIIVGLFIVALMIYD